MLEAVEAALPADVAIMAAAVADWRSAKEARGKIKKDGSGQARAAAAGREPGYSRHARPSPHAAGRRWSSASPPRPPISSATRAKKLAAKGADWILANDVSPAIGRHGRRREHDPPGQRRTASRSGRRCRRPGRAATDRAHRRRPPCPPRGGRVTPVAGPGHAASPWRRAAAAGGAHRRRRPGSISSPRWSVPHRSFGPGAGRWCRPASPSRFRTATRARCARAPALPASTASRCSTRRARSMPTIAAR